MTVKLLNATKPGLRLLWLLGLFLLLTPGLFADGPSIQIPRIDTPPALSDFADMEPSARVAGRMLKVTGFIARTRRRRPAYPEHRVYLAYDQHNLYSVSSAGTTSPTIRARMTRREDIFPTTPRDRDRHLPTRAGPAPSPPTPWHPVDALWTEGRLALERPWRLQRV